MKNKILISLCAVLAICCIVLSFCLASIKGESDNDASKASGTLPAQAAATSSDIQFKLSLLHLYYESQQLVSTLPYATVQITYAALIKAQIGAGQRCSAIRTYFQLRAYLRDELGLDPCAEVQMLYNQLIASDPSLLKLGPETFSL